MYYVGKNGSQSGPYPVDELKSMASSGRLAATDLVWTEGMSEWKPAGAALPDVFAQAPPPSPATPPVPAPPAAAPFPAPQAQPYPSAVDPAALGAPIPTYLWQSIVVTLCCCIPFGIPAIIFSTQVESKRQHGDIAGAVKASQNAKLWMLIALISGVFCNLGLAALSWWASLQKGHIQF